MNLGCLCRAKQRLATAIVSACEECVIDFKIAGILSIAVFYGAMFALGLWAARRTDHRNAAGLLVAGRAMPLWIGAFTMTATWVGGGYINGTAEAVYDPAGGLVWAQAPWGYALSLIVGGLFFAAPMRRRRYTTLLDPFEQRYGRRVAAVLFVPALVGEVFWSSAILVALGTTFGTIFDIDTQTAVLISAAVAISYTVVGGLWSVAYTDVAQLCCIFLGLCGALPFALARCGGIDELWSRYQAQFGEAASLIPPAQSFAGGGAWGYSGWIWMDMALLLILGGIPWGVYFQRVLACREVRHAVGLSFAAAFGCLLLALPAALIGAAGATADWSSLAVEPPEPAMVLPYVLRYLTPPIVAIVGLGAVAAAVMSSVDSSILSASSMFAWNVYRPLIRPAAGELESRRVVRAAVIVIGLLATALALSVNSVYALWYLCADLVYVILFPQLVGVLFFRRATSIGSLSAVAVGFFLRLGGGEPMLNLPAFLPYPMQDADGVIYFPFRTFAMLMSMATLWIVSWFTFQGTASDEGLAETS